MLQAMNESFPQWPGLLCKFVLPSGPKYFLLNLWITDSQATTPIGMLPTAGFRLAVQFYSDSAPEGNRRSVVDPLKPKLGTVFQLKVSCCAERLPFALATFALFPRTATSTTVACSSADSTRMSVTVILQQGKLHGIHHRQRDLV